MSKRKFPKLRTSKVVMGLETEYGYSDGEDGDAANCYSGDLPGVTCANSGDDTFLSNGARFYIDGARPEYATPECGDPWTLVAHARAGDRLVRKWASRIAANDGATVSLASSCLQAKDGNSEEDEEDIENDIEGLRCDMENEGHTKREIVRAIAAERRRLKEEAKERMEDGRDLAFVTWGAHESYSSPSGYSCDNTLLRQHLFSRIVLCGAGGFCKPDRISSNRIWFSIAPRLHRWAGQTPDDGGTHGDLVGGKEGRVHIACGESLCSDLALFLKFASTSLVFLVSQHNQPLPNFLLIEGRGALRTWIADPRKRVRGVNAFGLQRRIWRYVGKYLRESWMPDWAQKAHAIWGENIGVASGPLGGAAKRFDWALKKALYPRKATSAQLRALDSKFAVIGTGVFSNLKRQGLLEDGVVTEKAINRAMRNPPRDTRAYIRGCLIKRHSGDCEAYWDSIGAGERNYDIGDAWRSDGGVVEEEDGRW